jgi:DNA-binding beta-propeller fold protein YncE
MPDADTGPFARPFGLAVASGDVLLVADSGNNRIVVLNFDGTDSRSVSSAGSAIGPLSGPRGIDLRPDGRLVVADTGNHRVAFSGFTLTQVIDGTANETDWSAFGVPGSLPAAGDGQFKAPIAVFTDAAGRTLIADPGLLRLVRIDASDGSGWTVLPLPPALRPPQPYDISTGPDGTLLLTDIANSRVLQLAADGTVVTLIDGTIDRSIIAPIAAVLHGDGIVVADAAAAQLTGWTLDADTSRWTLKEHLLGIPAVTGGPSFPRLCGLTSSGAE